MKAFKYVALVVAMLSLANMADARRRACPAPCPAEEIACPAPCPVEEVAYCLDSCAPTLEYVGTHKEKSMCSPGTCIKTLCVEKRQDVYKIVPKNTCSAINIDENGCITETHCGDSIPCKVCPPKCPPKCPVKCPC